MELGGSGESGSIEGPFFIELRIEGQVVVGGAGPEAEMELVLI